MNWYFMRHGQIASNLKRVYSGRSEEVLTDTGREQVRQASRQLAGVEIDAIYSSPLARTRETAEIVIAERGWDLTINLDDRFNEFKMGPWEGMAEDDAAAQFPAEWAVWNHTPADLVIDGRETLAQLQLRVLDGLRAIANMTSHGSVLIVTHVAVIRVVELFATGRKLNDYKKIAVDNARIFKFQKLVL